MPNDHLRPPYDPDRLATLEDSFDPQRNLVLLPAYGMGYHTKISGGTLVHPIRESMEYAWLLAMQGNPDSRDKIKNIIIAIIALQDIDNSSPYLGIWPWFAEELVHQMDPPDRNWADFIGAFFVDILGFAREILDLPLIEKIEKSLRLACHAIIQRDVGSPYTNICAMGAAVTAATGTILKDKQLLQYGIDRIEKLEQRVLGFDVFDEYNSPAYTPILIEELDRILRHVENKKCISIAKRLHYLAWLGVAKHYHPPTNEWAGPHSRAYWDSLGEKQRDFLQKKLDPGTPQPCPSDLARAFTGTFTGKKTVESKVPDGRMLTTYFDPSGTLGTAKDDQMWTQRRPLLGHFRERDGSNSIFRLRVLLNGRDFAAARLEARQVETRILGRISIDPSYGVWHLFMDRPADGLVAIKDLRIRFEMQGLKIKAEIQDETRGILRSENHQIKIVLGPEKWQSSKVRFEYGHANEPIPGNGSQDQNWFPTTNDQGKSIANGAWLDCIIAGTEDTILDLSAIDFSGIVFGLSWDNQTNINNAPPLPQPVKLGKTRWIWTDIAGEKQITLSSSLPERSRRATFLKRSMWKIRNKLPISYQIISKIRYSVWKFQGRGTLEKSVS